MESRFLALIAVTATASSFPLQGQSPVDWLAKEKGVYESLLHNDFDSFALQLDTSFVAVYPIGVINRDMQIDAVKKEGFKGYRISDFTSRAVDPGTTILGYKLSVTNAAGTATYWVSSAWRLIGKDWRTILHTASPVVEPARPATQ